MFEFLSDKGQMTVYQPENLEIKCRILGQGPKVILLHGFGVRASDWTEVAEHLRVNYQVFIPHVSTFFMSRRPMTYSEQIEFLCHWLEQVSEPGEVLHLVGASYGATLSYGVRIKMGRRITSHTMINPMPFKPLRHLKNWRLRTLLWLSRLPGVLESFALTPWGTKLFASLAQIFYLGASKRGGAVSQLNKRKFVLIYQALNRFIWIDRHENWEMWRERKIDDGVSTHIIYSDKDQLFSRGTFLRVCSQFADVHVHVLKGVGHLATKSHPKWVIQRLVNIFITTQEGKKAA